MEAENKEIEIRPTGSYFEVDQDGYIVNPTSKEKIQERWWPVIDAIIGYYQKAYKDKLHSVYVRGSVAKGQAIEGVSDIDTFAYVNLPKSEINHDWVDAAEKELAESYDFVEGAELGASPVSDIKDDSIILNQSVCVFGTEVDVPKLKVGSELAIHSQKFYKRVDWFNEFLKKDETLEEVRKGCTWFMKGLLRVGFELTMDRSQKYTRDLYRCYETFAEYYPEKESEMLEVLHLALNPIADKAKLKEIVDGFGAWILAEAQKIFVKDSKDSSFA
ncbi:MAG: hypothetical protein FGM57_03730 [Candidatus Taylorbacteria bacterium]|nr:hypothetical protein [Candidatus Taylorbacteria bacterium]